MKNGSLNFLLFAGNVLHFPLFLPLSCSESSYFCMNSQLKACAFCVFKKTVYSPGKLNDVPFTMLHAKLIARARNHQ